MMSFRREKNEMKKVLMSVLKSPILHFLVLGVVAFLFYDHFKPAGRETIHITTRTVVALVRQRESITRNPVTPKERQEIIDRHIEDEILLREAYKRGFDKNDYRVRKRILNIMRASLGEVVPEPSAPQLRAFYEENKERYRTSPSRTFEQVYFSFASPDKPENPKQFLEQLKNTPDITKVGESSRMGKKFRKASFRTMAITFGKPFAETLFELPLDRWRGPVESSRGVHFIRVIQSHKPELPSFEKMEPYLWTKYLMRKDRDAQQQKIDRLRKGYDVLVEGAAPRDFGMRIAE